VFPRSGLVIGCGCVGYGRVGRPGGDLLSRVLGHSTMGAGDFHGRVRDGIGCGLPAKTTRSSSPFSGQWSAVRRRPDGLAQTGWGWGSGASVCAADLGMISMHDVSVRVSGGRY
jgi:hypothetical protein